MKTDKKANQAIIVCVENLFKANGIKGERILLKFLKAYEDFYCSSLIQIINNFLGNQIGNSDHAFPPSLTQGSLLTA